MRIGPTTTIETIELIRPTKNSTTIRLTDMTVICIPIDRLRGIATIPRIATQNNRIHSLVRNHLSFQ